MAYEFEVESVGKFTKAQESVQSALINLMAQKSLMDVTVKDLCQNAYVARSTFYAYYQNIDDVLAEIENFHLSNLIRSNNELLALDAASDNDLSFYSKTLDYILANAKTFETLLIKNPDYRFINKWKAAIKNHFYNKFFKDKSIKNEEFMLEAIASLIVSFDTYWLENSDKIDIESVYSTVQGLMTLYLM